tara:strand:- start:39 stop:476 length:438 start_codon:yes stop_codon:yes gene_type:complete
MSSIFVDTIRKTGGTLGTDIRVGATSVYESDNSTGTTQNLVQGLAKCWFQITGVSTASLNDSLNVSSFNDEGTANYKITYSNNMNNTTYSYSNGSGWDVGGTNSTYNGTDKDEILTSTLEIYHVNASDAATDANLSMGSIHGDLA